MKNRLSKILLISGCLVACILTIGSFGFGASTKPYAGVQLTIACIGDPYAARISQMIPEFEKLTGIKVNNEIFGYEDGRKKMLLDATTNSKIYDIYSIDVPWVGEFAPHVEPLTNYIKKTLATSEGKAILALEDYPPRVLAAHQWNGVQIGIPISSDVEMLFYRKDLFEKEGINPPKTLEEYFEVAKHFTRDTNGDGKIDFWGTCINGQRGAAVAQQWMAFYAAFGGKMVVEKNGRLTATFDSPLALHVTKWMKDLLQYCPPGTLNYAWDERWEQMAQGHIAELLAWSCRVFLAEDPTKSKVAGKIGYAIYPSAAGVKTGPGMGGYSFAINRDVPQKRKDAAWEFIKWACSKEQAKKLLATQNSGANRYSSLNDPDLIAKYPNFPVIRQSFEITDYDYRTRLPVYNTISDALGIEIHEYLLGEKSAEEALRNVQEAVSRELARSQ